MATYGSGANWAGSDDSDKSAAVNWSIDSDSAEFTIPAFSSATDAAGRLMEGWHAAYPNEQVNQDGSTVSWPSRTKITNMSFTVDDGPSQTVPGLGAAVPVYSELTVKNVS